MTYQIWFRRDRYGWELYWAGNDPDSYKGNVRFLEKNHVEHKCSFDGRWVKHGL